MTLLLWNPYLDTAILGATVTYKLTNGTVEGVMEERDNGIYFVDLSNADLIERKEPYKFQITITKEHYTTERDTYSIGIVPSPSFFEKYWFYVFGGTIVGFGLLGYDLRRRSQKQKQIMLLKDSNEIQIQNRFGVFRVNTDIGSITTIELFSSFVEKKVIGNRL